MQKRRSLRLDGYDYRNTGVYFVTVCTHQKRCVFGKILNDSMIPNECGFVVKEEWKRAEILRSNVELDMFVLMPNHLHGLILLRDEQDDGQRSASDFAATPTSSTLQAGSLGAIIGQFKSVATKRIRRLNNPPDMPIWQRNYYESIIRTPVIWNRARDYIATNPMRWREDSLYVA
ncbi:MAG: hypothetical protein F4X02_06385 [Chloroflexi bacterium]|nr:hypothetical protein [Chloroflexota bacterium]